MVNKALKGLYGITSQDMLLDNVLLLHKVKQALKGGMTILQYRNKHQPRLQSTDDLMCLKQLCHEYKALFIINDDAELCLQIGADGVHLGKDDGDLVYAREILGQKSIIGVSCYNDVSLAQRAKQQGASYIAFGAFYKSVTKPNAGIASINLIGQAKSLKLPICCIGGITVDNSKALIKEGSDMLAVVSELFDAKDIEFKAKKITQSFKQ